MEMTSSALPGAKECWSQSRLYRRQHGGTRGKYRRGVGSTREKYRVATYFPDVSPGGGVGDTIAYRVIPEALEAGWRFETAYNPTCSGGDVIRVLRDRSSDWAGRGVAARGWASIQGRAVITPPFALRKYFFFSSATPFPRPGRCCRINEWLECLWPETMQQRSMHNGKEFFKWSGPRGGAQRAGDLK